MVMVINGGSFSCFMENLNSLKQRRGQTSKPNRGHKRPTSATYNRPTVKF